MVIRSTEIKTNIFTNKKGWSATKTLNLFMIFLPIDSGKMDETRKNRKREGKARQTTVPTLLQGKDQLSHVI